MGLSANHGTYVLSRAAHKSCLSVYGRYHVPTVGLERSLFVVVHQIDAKLIDTHIAQQRELLDVVIDRTEHAETVDNVIWYEIGVRVTCPSMVGVVVALACLDVVRQRPRRV